MPSHLAITAMLFLVAAILVIAQGHENTIAQPNRQSLTEHITGVGDQGRFDSPLDSATIKPGDPWAII